MANSTIIITALFFITLLVGGGIYILMHEYFLKLFQKMRFASTLKQRKTINSDQKNIGYYINYLIEQFNLQNLFQVEKIKTILSDTGKSTTMTVDSILLAKIAMPILVGTTVFNFKLFGYIINENSPEFNLISAILSIVAGLATFPLPDYLIQIDAKKRAAEFMVSFPSVLDLLIICIQSGISFEHSLQRVTRDASILSPVMGEELSRIMRDIHLLGSREKALMNFKRRIPAPAVDDFVLVVLQSERYGTSMSDALHVLSSTVRSDQMTMLERAVLKMPTKVSFIIMVFMMPTVLIMVFAPILLGGISFE
jgi:tight adherence protein C